ncbi:O-antigen ligase family protein [Ruegeria profundi]|uniref:O-antigen ligase family protein n=1 Tax=Ruegeria profundi TaxID=1685378 RepID=UPI003C7C95C0
MPNTFAYLMLALWPIVMVVLFKKLPPARAFCISILAAHTILPTATYFDLPLVPTLDKKTVPSIFALLLCLTMFNQKIRFFPGSPIVSVLMIGYILSPFVTFASNLEPIFAGTLYFPGLTVRDAISESLKHVITLIPFVLGFNLLSTPDNKREFLALYMMTGLIYSIPILVEIRMSPQFNNWFYGFFPQLFAQQVRFGGFRPVVFIGHGLGVAFLILMSMLATAALLRGSSRKDSGNKFAILAYLSLILVLCKTVGAVLFAVLFAPIVLFARPKVQRWVMMVCAVFVLTYPVLRAADAIPVERLLSYASMIQAERAQSLGFRFENEEQLLERALEKPLTGWGYWNRNRNYDPETGRILTVPDGYWILIIGVLGWFGYICIFGLLTFPLLRLWAQRKECTGSADEFVTHGVAIMLSINLLELIPNATNNNLTWLMAGLLMAKITETVQEKNTQPTETRPELATGQHPKHVRKPRGEQKNSTAEYPEFHRRKRHPRTSQS